MGTRKNHKSNKRFRKTRSKRQRGGSGKRKAESSEEEPGDKKLKRTDYICPSETYKFNEMSKLWCKDRQASLDLHPDKNRDCKDEATAKFQEFNNKCNKVDVNAKDDIGDTALIRAVKDEDFYKVWELLDHPRIDVNAKNYNGDTALLLFEDTTEEIVRLLLKQPGIDVNAKNNHGDTALIKAAMEEGEYIEIVKMLLKHPGIDVNAKNNNHETALSISLLSVIGYIDTREMERMTKILLEHPGIDVNAEDGNGWTALQMASRNGNIEIVRIILKKGADVNAKNANGDTAIDIAIEEDYPEIVKLLKQEIVAQTIPRVLERQEDRKNLAMVMSEKDVGNRGDGTMPYDLRHKIGEYLGGGKRKTHRKNKKSKKSKRKGRKTRRK